MDITFESAGKQITTQDLDEVEKKLGVKFPSSLREHYLKFNGGQPEPNLFVDGDFEYDVDEFHEVLGEFEEAYEMVVLEKKLIPLRLIPFAINQGGDFFCMEKDTEEIYFYNMDYSAQPERAAKKIAPSLAYFLEHMVSEDELYGE